MTLEKFHFTANGEDFAIPHFKDLPMGVIRKARKGEDESDKVFTIIETVMGEGSPELDAIDNMSAEEFSAFLEAWTQGAPVGESSSSES